MTTVPIPTVGTAHVQPSQHRRDPPPPGVGLRTLRGLSGALALGLLVLTVTLAVAQWFSGTTTVPGPGAGTLVGHGAGTLAALVLQYAADRSRGRRAALAAAAVLAVVAVVLWVWWWR